MNGFARVDRESTTHQEHSSYFFSSLFFFLVAAHVHVQRCQDESPHDNRIMFMHREKIVVNVQGRTKHQEHGAI